LPYFEYFQASLSLFQCECLITSKLVNKNVFEIVINFSGAEVFLKKVWLMADVLHFKAGAVEEAKIMTRGKCQVKHKCNRENSTYPNICLNCGKAQSFAKSINRNCQQEANEVSRKPIVYCEA
jgi:hypothetical protein